MTPQEMLDQLAEYQAQLQLLALNKQELVDRVLTPEIKAQLEEIDQEFCAQVDAVDNKIAALEAAVKEAVIAGGATIKGAHLQAVYAKGRTSWDSKRLEGLMIALPQLAECRTIGAPSVSIRRIG